MKSDLKDVKVGQKIWTIQEGWTEVIRIIPFSEYPIQTEKDIYLDFDGKYEKEDKHPSAFLENPFEKEITREVEKKMLNDFRNYLFHHDCFDPFETDMMDNYLDQKYKPLPTAEEAAEKLGITVEQLKEIVK